MADNIGWWRHPGHIRKCGMAESNARAVAVARGKRKDSLRRTTGAMLTVGGSILAAFVASAFVVWIFSR